MDSVEIRVLNLPKQKVFSQFFSPKKMTFYKQSFTSILGEMIQFDLHSYFQMGGSTTN